jgi:hypothetical protein
MIFWREQHERTCPSSVFLVYYTGTLCREFIAVLPHFAVGPFLDTPFAERKIIAVYYQTKNKLDASS